MAGFKSVVSANVGTTAVQVLTATRPLTLIGVSLANVKGSSVEASVQLKKTAGTAFIVKAAPISKGDTLIVVGSDQKVVLDTGDILEVTANVAGAVDVLISYLEV